MRRALISFAASRRVACTYAKAEVHRQGGTAMLAEIFIFCLEAAARAANEAPPPARFFVSAVRSSASDRSAGLAQRF